MSSPIHLWCNTFLKHRDSGKFPVTLLGSYSIHSTEKQNLYSEKYLLSNIGANQSRTNIV